MPDPDRSTSESLPLHRQLPSLAPNIALNNLNVKLCGTRVVR